MKRTTAIWAIALFVLGGMTGCKQSGASEDLITVDVTKSYPPKELILQDFMDVEYIPLETTDEFVTQGDVLAIGNKFMVVKNWINDGDLFLFDAKTGKGLRKINRRGQGGEEYTYINGVVLDEENNELYVNCTPTKRILVYDLFGNFKRSLKHAEGAEYLYVMDCEKDNLICYDISGYSKDGKSREERSYHYIISKQDGRVVRNVPIPFDVITTPFIQKGDGAAAASVRPIVAYHDNSILIETSSDTVYKYLPDEDALIPFIVRTPSADPVVFLTMGVLTDRYYFMQTVKREFDFTTGRGFPTTDLMYDKQEKAIFSAAVFNGDYAKQQQVYLTAQPINSEIAAYQTLSANKLVEAYENDQLKGQLKEIAAKLNSESNPVVMLMREKK